MIKRPYKLTAKVASSASINEDDTLAIKSALVKTGDYKIPDYGLTEYPDQSMFDGITKFQKKNNLKIDGIMNPGGETEQALFGEKPRNNLTQPRQKPKPKKPVPIGQTPGINGETYAKPEITWWDLLLKDHKIPDEMHSANDRAVGVIKNHANAGEHPTWIADDINQAVKDGSENRAKGHIASLADILQKLNEVEPSKADDYLIRFFDQLSTSAKSYFSQMTASDNQDKTENDNDEEAKKVKVAETSDTSNEDDPDETNLIHPKDREPSLGDDYEYGYMDGDILYFRDPMDGPYGRYIALDINDIELKDTIDGNQQQYRLMNIVLNHKEDAIQCKFFQSAYEVTSLNAVGAADWDLAGGFGKDEVDNFLIATHHGLAEHNHDIFNHLSNGKEYPSLEGLSGKELDYALVELEQNKLEELTNQYFKDNPNVDRDDIMQQISENSTTGWKAGVSNKYVKEAIDRLPEGVEYDFNNKEHRIMIGKAMIDIMYEENEK